MENNAYVSCMKIKGVPILPPLITPNLRQELLDLKNRAVQLEKMYVERKEKSEKNGTEFESTISNTIDEINSDDLFLLSDSSSFNRILRDMSSPMKYVPYENGQKTFNHPSKNLEKVLKSIAPSPISKNSSFSNEPNGLSTLQVELNLDKPLSLTDKESGEKFDILSASTEIVLDNNSSESESENTLLERPPLIRSNSYTLDNPSPLLLAHLKKLSSIELNDIQPITGVQHEENSELTYGLHIPSITSSRKPDDSMLNIMPINNCNTSETYPENEINEEYTREIKPTVEVITTDITVQQINITTSINSSIKDKELTEVLNTHVEAVDENDNEEISIDSEIELKSILQQIPENYSKKILELIERQKMEQLKRFQNYENLKNGLLDIGDIRNNNNNNFEINMPSTILVSSKAKPRTSPIGLKSNMESMRSRSICESTNLNHDHSPRPRISSAAESQSLHYDMSTSCSESLDEDILSSVKIQDVESEGSIDYLSMYEKMYPLISKDSWKTDSKCVQSKDCSLIDKNTLKLIEQQKAAAVICAYAKGYLVRRLMRTMKVQTLIQTIQDALICALELQGSDTIEEADVELHRRLIQQVSSACYDFHDVFFALTIPEQMDLISIDREKKKKALSIKTSRSNIDFHSRTRHNDSIRLTKSLTKV